MAFGGPTAIYLAKPTRPQHRFNDKVIGQGREYLNEAATGDLCIIRLNAGTPWKRLTPNLLFVHALDVACRIGTDTQPTVFLGNIADKLNLQPLDPFPARVSTFLDSHVGWWCKHELWLSLGPGYMPLEVWFPVELGGRGWQWRYGFPQWNVLGMRNVLNRRMLCVTSEEVFAFERV